MAWRRDRVRQRGECKFRDPAGDEHPGRYKCPEEQWQQGRGCGRAGNRAQRHQRGQGDGHANPCRSMMARKWHADFTIAGIRAEPLRWMYTS